MSRHGGFGPPLWFLWCRGISHGPLRWFSQLETSIKQSWLVVWHIFLHILGMVIPIDVHIFQRGRYTTNQKGICSHGYVFSSRTWYQKPSTMSLAPTDFRLKMFMYTQNCLSLLDWHEIEDQKYVCHVWKRMPAQRLLQGIFHGYVKWPNGIRCYEMVIMDVSGICANHHFLPLHMPTGLLHGDFGYRWGIVGQSPPHCLNFAHRWDSKLDRNPTPLGFYEFPFGFSFSRPDRPDAPCLVYLPTKLGHLLR